MKYCYKKAKTVFVWNGKVDRKQEGHERIINGRTQLRAKEETPSVV